MSERSSLENVRSRHLPPLEAWKQPEKWVDISTGLPRPDISRLVLPTDDRGFINPSQVVEMVEDTLFWKDYNWPYEQGEQETASDDHHFYYTAAEYSPLNNSGSDIPSMFRTLPTVIGRMPRQFHNTIHDFTEKPAMPDIDAMAEYYQSYLLAYRAFQGVMQSAKNTTQASRMFATRQKAVQDGLVHPSDPEDIVAKEMMRDFFSRHFEAYSQLVNRLMELPGRPLVIPDTEKLSQYKPHVAVKKMSRFVLKGRVNYTPYLRAA